MIYNKYKKISYPSNCIKLWEKLNNIPKEDGYQMVYWEDGKTIRMYLTVESDLFEKGLPLWENSTSLSELERKSLQHMKRCKNGK